LQQKTIPRVSLVKVDCQQGTRTAQDQYKDHLKLGRSALLPVLLIVNRDRRNERPGSASTHSRRFTIDIPTRRRRRIETNRSNPLFILNETKNRERRQLKNKTTMPLNSPSNISNSGGVESDNTDEIQEEEGEGGGAKPPVSDGAVTNNTTNSASSSSSSSPSQSKPTSSTTKQPHPKPEYNQKWFGYVLILFTSLLNWTSISSVPNDQRRRNWRMAIAFGVMTFLIASLVLLQDRTQRFFISIFHYTKAKDGYVEGYVLLCTCIWWIVGYVCTSMALCCVIRRLFVEVRGGWTFWLVLCSNLSWSGPAWPKYSAVLA
jgi:hypothetical protein